MAKKTKKDYQFIIRCPHCCTEEFRLSDVKPEAPIKFYTDTPCKATHGQNFSNSAKGNKQNEINLSTAKPTPVIDEEVESVRDNAIERIPTRSSPFSRHELNVISPPLRRVRTSNSAFSPIDENEEEGKSPNLVHLSV